MSDIVLGGITLPGDMQWIDEFAPWRVGQAVRTTLGGALVIHQSARQAGRPITLQTYDAGASKYAGAIPLATLNALRTLEDQVATTPLTLSIPGYNGGAARTFDVLFRRSDGAAIEAEPLIFKAPFHDTDYFRVVLRLIEV